MASWWAWHSGLVQRTAENSKWSVIAASTKFGFALDEIFVEGRHQTLAPELLDALQLKRGAPILAFNPETAHTRLKSLPWVESVSIERHLPDAIHLRISERRPMALWQKDGRFQLLDTTGKVVPINNIGRFGNLITVIGPDAPLHASELLDTLALMPELSRRVNAAVRIGARRWDLHLENRLAIQLPEFGPEIALRQLGELQQSNAILDCNFAAIDLRIDGRVVLRPNRGFDDNVTPVSAVKPPIMETNT
ncbi:MAG: FtsQ-type POTRA domain-containing protein [Pseudomonadota bacterium]|nr:FtsQ-type POTRA domain-containing protein [Pseudomonadota bacterium]